MGRDARAKGYQRRVTCTVFVSRPLAGFLVNCPISIIRRMAVVACGGLKPVWKRAKSLSPSMVLLTPGLLANRQHVDQGGNVGFRPAEVEYALIRIARISKLNAPTGSVFHIESFIRSSPRR